ncbi:ephrin-A4 isoform X2 [Sceloporus undulatus]|uniref:ephrin-A4 isoform X2 n=1 Tax=Sceloporus undulatus TaxID=8520 RepID=UPI001C4C1BD4|nr:ephrin-A4 isoform X2 [Sceloporus undulatus]
MYVSRFFWEFPKSCPACLLLLWRLKASLQVKIVPGTHTSYIFLDDDYTVQVSLNDNVDIYCPHYEQPLAVREPESFILLMVNREGYEGCYETEGAFRRWECNRPYAPYGPVRFSEKIQKFTPYSLGFEFQPGHDYYYISIPNSESSGRCLKLRLSVCCKATTAEPVTEGPKSQPHGRGGSEDAAVLPGRSSAPSWRSCPCLGLIPFLSLWL